MIVFEWLYVMSTIVVFDGNDWMYLMSEWEKQTKTTMAAVGERASERERGEFILLCTVHLKKGSHNSNIT